MYLQQQPINIHKLVNSPSYIHVLYILRTFLYPTKIDWWNNPEEFWHDRRQQFARRHFLCLFTRRNDQVASRLTGYFLDFFKCSYSYTIYICYKKETRNPVQKIRTRVEQKIRERFCWLQLLFASFLLFTTRTFTESHNDLLRPTIILLSCSTRATS